MATFTPGVRLAPDILGNKRAILGAIFLDITKTCFQIFAGTIMCYGQTGAGKTYTMTGTTENYKHRGILPRALQQVERAHRWGATEGPLSTTAAADLRPAIEDRISIAGVRVQGPQETEVSKSDPSLCGASFFICEGGIWTRQLTSCCCADL